MIYLIGMGPGNLENTTVEALDILKKSSYSISFGRIGLSAENSVENIIKIKTITEIKDVLDKLKENISDKEVISILASGDPCFYGILEYLKKLDIDIERVIPGVSSIQYMMATLQMSWHSANLLSFHGREEDKEEKINSILNSEISIILTDKKNTPNSISHTLYDRGMKGIIYAGFELSYEDEEIIKADIGEEIKNKSSLAVVVVVNKESS